MEKLPGSVILKLLMLALIGGIGLLPSEASAQFGLSIPIPRFDLPLRPPAYHPTPSHRSGSQTKHEDTDRSAPEKDATQEPNTGPSAEHHPQQQQVSTPHAADPPSDNPGPRQNNADTPPAFSPSR